MADRVTTGLGMLDRRLGGGIPAGSVVALSAPPASQIELFLYNAAAAHDTTYLSFYRPEETIEGNIQETIPRADGYTVRRLPREDPIEAAIDAIASAPKGTNVVVDPHTVAEQQGRERLVEFVNELGRRVEEAGSIALLNCPAGDHAPELRGTTEYLADVVFQLETVVSGSQIENRLAVPKFRGGQALPETIKLRITDRIEIDTSRDIG